MNNNRIGFRSAHPVSALLFFIMAFTAGTASTHPMLLAVCFVVAAATDIMLQGKKARRLLFRTLLPLIVMISCFNGLYNHYGVTVLFRTAGGTRFTLEAILYGLVFAVKLACAILWLDLMAEILPSEKVIFLFGRFSPRLALVISMTLRFLPLIRRQSAEINAAQQGLGATTSGNLFYRVKAAAHRLSILVSWTLERGIDTADSMRSRGYGLKHRSFYNRFVFSPADTVVTTVSIVAFTLYLLSAKSFKTIYNPVVTVPFPTVFGWISFVTLTAALLLPVMTELITRTSVSQRGRRSVPRKETAGMIGS